MCDKCSCWKCFQVESHQRYEHLCISFSLLIALNQGYCGNINVCSFSPPVPVCCIPVGPHLLSRDPLTCLSVLYDCWLEMKGLVDKPSYIVELLEKGVTLEDVIDVHICEQALVSSTFMSFF